MTTKHANQLTRGDVITVCNAYGTRIDFTVMGASRAAAATADRIGIVVRNASGRDHMRFYDLDETVEVI